MNIVSAITNTIPITMFNRGFAGKIFDEVKQNGPKVVMKNNAAECVLISPEEYVALMDEVNDARLLLLANKRVQNENMSLAIPAEKIYEEFGITEDDLASASEVDIE